MHCTEYQLELLAAFSNELSEPEQAWIAAHISECQLCEERWETWRSFYAELEHRLQQEPSEKDTFYAALLQGKGFSILDFPNYRWN
jgi:hypothetical protein